MEENRGRQGSVNRKDGRWKGRRGETGEKGRREEGRGLLNEWMEERRRGGT